MFFIWACDGEKKLQQQNKWETALMAPIRTRFSARHCLANSHVIRRVWHVIANASILFHVSPFAVNWNPLFLARTTWVQFNSVDWDQSEPIASSLGFISISASFVSLSGCLNWKSKKKTFMWKDLGEADRIFENSLRLHHSMVTRLESIDSSSVLNQGRGIFDWPFGADGYTKLDKS